VRIPTYSGIGVLYVCLLVIRMDVFCMRNCTYTLCMYSWAFYGTNFILVPIEFRGHGEVISVVDMIV
jgi:hypothetical protein